MSVSKLESLPNEILTDILEKYINGIDIIKAFAFQLNRRFDVLIAQCQRLRFDFMRCHKDDFRLCIGLLPVYIDKIEELALSEQNTPGQIHAFLSFYPSFGAFKQLRKLHFHINVEAVESQLIENALRSISTTTLHTLTIKITKAQELSSLDRSSGEIFRWKAYELYSLDITIADIFRMKTLKKLSLIFDSYQANWTSISEISSNIKHLTISGTPCYPEDLMHIFRCASDLQYLNIQVSAVTYYQYKTKSKSSSEDLMTRMPMLHTAVFNIERDAHKTVEQLGPYLRCMSSLQRLEIKTQSTIDDISVWETLLETALPTLTYFNLHYSGDRLITDVYINSIRTSIQTPFWVEKQNFNVIITELGVLNNTQFNLENTHTMSNHGLTQPAVKWWIEPCRQPLNSNESVFNKIFSLQLSTKCSSLLQHHYLNNVIHLKLNELDDNLFKLITTQINCSRIKHLDCSYLTQENNKISSFLPNVRNITSLRITMRQVLDCEFARLKECDKVKFLDICDDQYTFDENNISIIANLFPNTEHLIVNTGDVWNVPLLQTYLPRLHSFTFATNELRKIFSNDTYQQKMLDVNLRKKTKFLFHRKNRRITVWLDEAALQDSYWQTTNTSLQSLIVKTANVMHNDSDNMSSAESDSE